MGVAVPHRKGSRQDYQTPPIFLWAVKRKLGIPEFRIDLAASHTNTVAPDFYDEAMDSMKQDWNVGGGWAWCNPPYAQIEPWVAKAEFQSHRNGAHVAMLVPASVGANWWNAWVHQCCQIFFLNGRLTFVGESTPYPRDLALCLYTPWGSNGIDVWRWREEVPAEAYKSMQGLPGLQLEP